MAITRHIHRDPAKAREAERLRGQFQRVLRLIKFSPVSQNGYQGVSGRVATWDSWLLSYLLHRLKFLSNNPFVVNWLMEWSGSRAGWSTLHGKFADPQSRRKRMRDDFFSRRAGATDLRRLSDISTGARRCINLED